MSKQNRTLPDPVFLMKNDRIPCRCWHGGRSGGCRRVAVMLEKGESKTQISSLLPKNREKIVKNYGEEIIAIVML